MEDYVQRLLDALVAERRVKRHKVEEVLRVAEETHHSPETVLVAGGHVSRNDLLELKARLFGVAAVDLARQTVDPTVAHVLPHAMAQRYRSVCLSRDGDRIVVAMADPSDAFAVGYIRMRTGYEVESRVAYLGDIEQILARIYANAPPAGPTPRPFRDRIGQAVVRARVAHNPPPSLERHVTETALRRPVPMRITLGAGPTAAASPDARLEAIVHLSLDLASTLNEDAIIARILDAMVDCFDAEAASLLLVDWQKSIMFFRDARGPGSSDVKQVKLPLNEHSVAGWVAMHRAPANIPDVSRDPRHCGDVDETVKYRTRSLLAVPVMWGNDVLGVLELLNKRNGSFDDRDVELLGIVAAQTAVALESSMVLQQLHNFYQQTLETLIECFQAYDPVSREHVTNVARLATAMGEAAGLEGDDLETLCYAALLHDIGKIRCSNPEDPRHAERGAQLLQQITLFSRIVPMVRHHHERWDGSGFPGGLAGEDTSLPARILAVAESWFEEAGGNLAALDSFRARFGKDFDPALEAPLLGALQAPGA